MPDSEMVIRGLTAHKNGNCNEKDCPYYLDDEDGCLRKLIDDTLELIEVSRPVEPDYTASADPGAKPIPWNEVEVPANFRKDCPMRHENGNCLPMGGFCTAVNDEICKVLKSAYEQGKHDGVGQYLREREEDEEWE